MDTNHEERIDRLEQIIREQEARIADYNLLGAVKAQLLGSRTCAEAYRILSLQVPALFPGVSGALYMHREADHATFERAIVWGSKKERRIFARHECRSLGYQRPHHVERAQGSGLQCAHARRADQNSLCLPLLTEEIALGVVYLQGEAESLTPWKRKLADELASFCAMLLRNLRLREMLSEQAIRDPLTRLYNRRCMEESLRRELCAREQRPVGIIMIDIDHFKSFNWRFTHDGGDALLRAFGTFLEKQVRPGDVACRYGGEEFMLLLPGASVKSVCQRAEKIRREASELSVMHQNQPLGSITLSLGADVAVAGTNPETALQGAVWAVREAKRKGRNRVVVATTCRQPAEQALIANGE